MKLGKSLNGVWTSFATTLFVAFCSVVSYIGYRRAQADVAYYQALVDSGEPYAKVLESEQLGMSVMFVVLLIGLAATLVSLVGATYAYWTYHTTTPQRCVGHRGRWFGHTHMKISGENVGACNRRGCNHNA